MIFHITLFFAICVFFVSGLNIVNTGPRYPPTKGEIWPKPRSVHKFNHCFHFNPSVFKVFITQHTCGLLEAAVERYSFIVSSMTNLNRRMKNKRMAPDNNSTLQLSTLQDLRIRLLSPCEDYPHVDMDESYNLYILTNSKLACTSVWGCIRGLESWAQSFYFTDDYNELRVNMTYIIDRPRYTHRGLLIDTSRHYISLSQILKTLDAMAMNKMNVLHWHMVDDQSFPYQSEVYPDLSKKGAYMQRMIYTKADIALVVQYARERGIRVLPEFDVPGHTWSWGNTFPEILTECYKDGKMVGLGPMEPTKNITYKVLENLFKEVQERFPDKYFHVGGDEVDLSCWSSNPDVQKYMKEHNLTVKQLLSFFMKNMVGLLGNRSQPVIWQEVFDEGVPLSPDTLVQVWKWGWVDEMVRVLQSGHRLIFSAAWYLTQTKSGGDWLDFYLADPRTMVVGKLGNSTNLLQNIVGGEACMWGEWIDNSNFISRVWPRASAVAERLWSNAIDTVIDDTSLRHSKRFQDAMDGVRSRLEEHTCRMRRVGIQAQPPNGPGFCVGVAS